MMSKIVIGTWPLSGDFGKISATKCQDVLEYCYELGIKEFDTAPNYGNGFIENQLGVVFKKKVDVLINTKMGNFPFKKKSYQVKELTKSFAESLKKLQRDSINILFLHNPRDEIEDYAEVLDFMHELKDKNKINEIGLSKARNFNYEKFVNLEEFDVIQDDINLLSLDVLKKPKPKGIVLMARSPLASGLLANRITEKTIFPPDDQRSTWLYGERLKSLMRRIREIKKISNLELSSLAIQFLLNQSSIDKIIFGIKSREHIKDITSEINEKLLDESISQSLIKLYDNDFGLNNEIEFAY